MNVRMDQGIRIGGGSGYAPRRVAPPAGFAWDFGTYPVSVTKDGPRHFATSFDPLTLMPSGWLSWPVFYVNALTGNNSNAGTSRTTPVRAVWKAKQLGEAAAGSGYIIISLVTASTGRVLYDRNNDYNDTGNVNGQGTMLPGKPFALMSEGGVSYMGPVQPGLTWTYDATSRCYNATRPGVATVVDASSFNTWGIFKRLNKIAAGTDLAATRTLVGAAVRNTGEGAWAQSGNEVVIRLEDDREANNATVRVCLTTQDALKLGTQPAYVSGFGIIGGAGSVGGTDVMGTANRNVVFDDCDFSFAGTDGGMARNSIVVDNMTGMVALRRCTGGGSLNDIFNFHCSGASQLHALMVDCAGIDAGRPGPSPASLSNQIVTAHENVRLMSLNTKGMLSAGGCVRNINSSQHWDLGSEYGYDRGDVQYGGTQMSAGVAINDTSKYWGDCITVRGCETSFQATSGTEMRLRDPVEIGCGPRTGTGLIAAY